MKGTQNDTRNQMKNELPFIRPTTPPARPKKNRITSRPRPCTGPPDPPDSEQRVQGPEHGYDRGHRERNPEHRDDEPYDHVDRERSYGDYHQAGDRALENRRLTP